MDPRPAQESAGAGDRTAVASGGGDQRTAAARCGRPRHAVAGLLCASAVGRTRTAPLRYCPPAASRGGVTALVLAVVLVWRTLRPQPLQPAARYAILLLLLMLLLSGLGFASTDPRRALVGALNIVGGLGLVTFSWRVAMAAGAVGTTQPSTDGSAFLLRAGVVVQRLAVVIGFGGRHLFGARLPDAFMPVRLTS